MIKSQTMRCVTLYVCTNRYMFYDCNLPIAVSCGSSHIKNIDLIESVQHRATQWIKSSFDPSHYNGLNLAVNVSRSLDGLPCSCVVIMLVL